MKKLLLVLFIAGFVGMAFAFSPSQVIATNNIDTTELCDDTTKTKKAEATKKNCASKKSCCKSKCSGKKTNK